MTSLKCKICGGDVIPQGDVGVCDSCGTRVSLENVSEERMIENRNRANEARLNQDYAAAARAWGRIAADEPQSAEAHWNLALSRYGINYVWDDLLGDFVPSMNALRFEPFTQDPDYQAAVEYADEFGLVYYMQEGKKLAELQARGLELIRSQPDYDVFLCCCSEDNGVPTLDDRYAREVYGALTDKGLRVFYGPLALGGVSKAGQEPYVFSALYSSKVMVLLATQAGYLNYTWVKNEWTRFSAMMQEDRSKHLIPVYAHMAPEFFPEEIRTTEAVDLTVSGSMMDLVRSILRLAGKDSAAGSYAEVRHIITKMVEALQQADYREVNKLGREALVMSPGQADVLFMLFLAENHINSEAQLMTATINWMESNYFSSAYEIAPRRRRALLDEVKNNYEAYQQRLSQDEALQKEARDAEETASRMAEKARGLMGMGQFRAARDILNDNIMTTKQVVEMRDDCELGVQYEDLDKERYLMDAITQSHPGIMQEFDAINKPFTNRTLCFFSQRTMAMLGFLLAGAFLIVTRLVLASDIDLGLLLIVDGLPVLFGAAAMVGASLAMGFMKENKGSVDLLPLLVVIALAAVLAWATMKVFQLEIQYYNAEDRDPAQAMLLYLVAAMHFAFAAVFIYTKLKVGRGRREKVIAFFQKNIKPLETQLIREYEEKFAPLSKYIMLQPPASVITVKWAAM